MNWLDTLKQIAPTVATCLGGPLAGAAVSAMGDIFGMSSPTKDNIAQLFKDGQITPEHIAELRRLELSYQNEEKERGFRYAELTYKDTDSARQMQISTQSYIPATLALLVTLGFFGILGFLVVNSAYKPTEPLLVMLGSLGTSWTMIVGFYFGSSHGSQNKDALLAQSNPPIQPIAKLPTR
jgi:hypothetical protein